MRAKDLVRSPSMSTRSRSLVRTTLNRQKRRDEAVLLVGTPKEESENTNDRDYDCQNYNTCLRFAIAKGWEGFSCMNCVDYKKSTVELEQAAHGIGTSLAAARRD